MNKLPPEILAIKLPDGMKWVVFGDDPAAMVREVNGFAGWVNPGSTYAGVYIVKSERHVSVEPSTSIVDLCKILAAYLWINP